MTQSKSGSSAAERDLDRMLPLKTWLAIAPRTEEEIEMYHFVQKGFEDIIAADAEIQRKKLAQRKKKSEQKGFRDSN